ncbi:glucose-6-phosphate dehydrogenase assembly protein OpcA [uncultured Paludibaculum sp.]|uniref:glucose-6-phosphate dehydrogenase assembly protein OpcA n=1 Tax=uncultured Paludibaculum sp. TaxID=1765020 RepID=UPI002AAC30B1|nr:glucose-6-phosphate dehydrogenase assembly protein OpcA [uncultured Paludibaculum sp.]
MAETAVFDAGRLLKELDANWRSIGKSEGSGVLRACAMTLIVVVRAEDDPQALGDTLAEIMHEHPNRTIVVRVGEGDAPVEARTTLQCWMPFGRRQQICCEQIDISATRGNLAAVPPIIFGLMVADLPVALWCRELSLASLEELRPVLRLAGKVMVDSSSQRDAVKAVECLKKLSSGTWTIADLTWARITRWRETVAQILRRGEQMDWCEVTYAGKGISTAAAYLAAWLGKVTDADVPLRCEDEECPPPGLGRIRSVRLQGGDRSVALRRTGRTSLSIEAGRMGSTAVFPLHTDAMLLQEELGVFGRDPLFEQALAALPEVVRG